MTDDTDFPYSGGYDPEKAASFFATY